MKLSVLILIGAALSSNALYAGTLLFSNFGDASNPYSSTAGLSVTYGDAVPFTVNLTPDPGTSFALDSIEFVASVADFTQPVDVSLFSDSNGLPGSSLETLSTLLNSANPDTIVTSVENPLLVTGQQYWIVLSDPNAATNPNYLTWNFAGTQGQNPVPEGVANDNEGWIFSNGYTQGAVSVTAMEVTPSPEPGTFLALGSGLAFLIVCRFRRPAFLKGR